MAIKGIADDVVSAMNFDPFEALSNEDGGSTGGQQDQGARPGQGGGADQGRDQRTGRYTKQTPAAPKATEAQPAAPTPVAPAPTLRKPTDTPAAVPPGQQQQDPNAPPVNAIEQMMQRMRDTPAAFLTPSAATPESAGPGPAVQPGATSAPASGWSHDYSKPWAEQKVNLPDQLLAAIFNEDPKVAAQGMNVLVNTMYNSIMNDIHTRVAEVLFHAPTMTAQTADLKVQQNALKTKFYGKWPELNDGQGMATVHTLALNIANMYEGMGQKVDPMSDDFIDYVGQQAMKMLGRERPAAPAPRRQFATGGASRENGGVADPFMSAIGMA